MNNTLSHCEEAAGGVEVENSCNIKHMDFNVPCPITRHGSLSSAASSKLDQKGVTEVRPLISAWDSEDGVNVGDLSGLLHLHPRPKSSSEVLIYLPVSKWMGPQNQTPIEKPKLASCQLQRGNQQMREIFSTE